MNTTEATKTTRKYTPRGEVKRAICEMLSTGPASTLELEKATGYGLKAILYNCALLAEEKKIVFTGHKDRARVYRLKSEIRRAEKAAKVQEQKAEVVPIKPREEPASDGKLKPYQERRIEAVNAIFAILSPLTADERKAVLAAVESLL